MAEKEFRKYDSNSKYRCAGVRLAKDAEVKDGQHGPMVRFTFVDSSRNDSDSEMWWEANVADHQAAMGSFLEKGDVLHEVEGKPVLGRYGENNEKFSLRLRRATFVVPNDMFAVLKERGWDPASKDGVRGAAPAKKPAGKKVAGKPAAKPVGKPAKKPAPVEMPDDDDDIVYEDDDSDLE